MLFWERQPHRLYVATPSKIDQSPFFPGLGQSRASSFYTLRKWNTVYFEVCVEIRSVDSTPFILTLYIVAMSIRWCVFLLLLLGLVGESVEQFFTQRLAVGCGLNGDDIYCYGGASPENIEQMDVVKLTLEQPEPFNVSRAPWRILPTPTLPSASWNYAKVVNGHLLIMEGSIQSGDRVIDYDIKNDAWTFPKQLGTLPLRTTMGAVDTDGKVVYLSGGIVDEVTNKTYPKDKFEGVATMSVYNPATATWTQLRSAWSPTYQHSMNILQDGRLLVIGGLLYTPSTKEQYAAKSLDTVDVYDPKTQSWQSLPTQGFKNQTRIGHSAVTMGNKILVYGGSTYDGILASPDMLLLDLSTSPYTWTIPSVANSPKPRQLHNAFYYRDRYMVVAFGMTDSTQGQIRPAIPDLLVLDSKEWSWLDTFSPATGGQPAPPNPKTTATPATEKSDGPRPSSDENRLAIGLGAGLGGGGLLLGGCGLLVFVLSRRRRRKRGGRRNSTFRTIEPGEDRPDLTQANPFYLQTYNSSQPHFAPFNASVQTLNEKLNEADVDRKISGTLPTLLKNKLDIPEANPAPGWKPDEVIEAPLVSPSSNSLQYKKPDERHQ
ncbi:uncharacterized protein VTP21DRAFT_6962 [Calcarisporiella thermophila]|uniref:uncharacterized protein n=1 Tax=Calcarisporiella thermophila TaxID=911321 RepID=UPI00374295AE